MTPAYLAEARALCDRHDALLVLDEVQTGIGRLGEWFGFQRLGVRPDAVCLAKGLGAGLPIGALVADEVGDGFQRGDHATTFGGSPPIAAAALAVLDAIEREGLVENARSVGAHLAERAAAIEAWPVRGPRPPARGRARGGAVGRGRACAARRRRARQRDRADRAAAVPAAVLAARRGRQLLRRARGGARAGARRSRA